VHKLHEKYGKAVCRHVGLEYTANHIYPLCNAIGPVVRVSPYELDISEIDAVKEIHRVGGHYRKSDFYSNIGHRSIRTLFSTTDAQHHAVRRRLLSAGMAHTNLARVEPAVQDRVQLTIKQMAGEMSRRGAVDVFKWWTFMATDVIGELSFGQSFQTLEHGEVW
jgi:cytochrome P450